ncbi:hypothetical protein [Chryseobacterium gambrini]|uniref:Uncharacterized protein n=1 Tax=Chryseobacterium gambrini TaxID=373672 RepID=A0A1N7PSV1_9FLAO|nr:hypothetical protein [Chryseobacterium gambrini]SIT13519.1 hypothetical protein SAMN05421785_107167 [Chryseobacterium gambrini]
MKTGNIGIRNLADIGVEDIDVYGTRRSRKSVEINNLKVRVNSTYNGEFGFDWIDVDPKTGEILKIQGVSFSEAEYFYKKPINQNDIGNFIPISSDINSAKNAIKEHYELLTIKNSNQIVDIPWVLMKPNQTIELSLETSLEEKSNSYFDKISIFGDEYYDFEIINKKNTGKKAGKKAEMEVSELSESILLKIKCLKEAPEKKYEILGEATSGSSLKIGGLTMMENKVLKLKFRVIALVSSDGNPSAKAKALFQKFKDSDVKKYLNENSLNQAGYEIEIENQTMFDTLGSGDLDDYFYAFDKTDWTGKKYFANINKEKQDVDAAGNCKITSWDPVKKECAKIIVPTDVIVDNQKDIGLADKDNDMDAVTIREYKNKLKTKSKSYEGGIIILSDFESSDKETGAYSRTSPLDHYTLMVYSTNTESKDTYAHEIGHMLGLDHLFFNTKELNSFNNSKNYYQTLKTNIITKTRESYPFYIYKEIKAKVTTLKESLNNFINNRKNYIIGKERDLAQGKASNGNFTYNGKPVTKAQYLTLLQEDIDKQKAYITENKKAIEIINTNKIKDFEELKTNFNILKNDSIKLDKEFMKFYEKEWEQIEANFLRFKKASTKNIMDYDNTRVCFLSHQIKIMRNDIKNY